ncbi:MAG: hypothetical protein ACKV0T_00560, partial [Planctomycetales bacterium]
MFRSSIIRRYVSLAVLTSYLLVATLSGMFHDHGEECCTAASASAVPNCAASHSKTCAHHHHRGGHKHRHQAANCAKRSVEPNSPDRA